MTKFSALPFAAALSLAGAAPASAKDVADFAITPGSAEAMIVFKAPDIPRPPGYKTSWRMGLQSYDPAEQKLKGAGPYGGIETLAGRPKSFVDGYLVELVKPGTYVFRDFSRQDYWSLCFNGASLQFTISPGQILYLGEFDAVKHLVELERLTISSGQTSTRGQPVQFFDTVSPPAFAPADEAGLAAVAATIKARMPKTTVAPKAARFAPARFGTGRDLFGLMRICGGYYAKKAKPKG